MEGELVSDLPSSTGEEQQVVDLSHLTYIFNKQLPFYLAIGMTAEEYWHGDCTLTIAYREAFELKKRMINEQLWWQGMYIYEALNDVLPAICTLGKKPVKEYPKEPHPVTKKQAEEQKLRDEKANYELAQATMGALVKEINKKFKEEATE